MKRFVGVMFLTTLNILVVVADILTGYYIGALALFVITLIFILQAASTGHVLEKMYKESQKNNAYQVNGKSDNTAPECEQNKVDF